MAELRRTASASWTGDLRGGAGTISSGSGVLESAAYSFGTRFQHASGTNPEELLAAAHAACYSMNLAATLAAQGHTAQEVTTSATCTLRSREGGGWKIARMHLQARARVDGLDDAAFGQIAAEAERTCPVSAALRPGLEVTLEAALLS